MTLMERTLVRAENLLGTIATLLILSIMVIVTADVVLRYLFHSPIEWAFDVISLYLMAGVFFLSLSGTHADHGHVGVDLLLQRLAPTGRRLAETLTCLVSIPFFAAMAKVGADRAIDSFLNHDALSGLIAWPTWIASALVPVGAGLLALRLVLRLVSQIASLATGRDYAAVIPLGGHAGTE
ncbi:TRAP transporter small permease [Azospirillum sp. TSO35-2]|uniref:TRAP transporter small permease subunit n=1 Tax=Azospirillum sp. TSO35-2 TaxID=716796 RepID=UPI000D61CBA0|nr:TRAP transporter small permease [Azospirillum sp. TSO35-2]PWC39522.1 hypothetical protein TSO352_05120 [Azospirillum sp. TSO35-2]